MPDAAPDRTPISLWDASSAESETASAFEEGDRQVDVAIVGGGYTGLSTALHAAESGLHAHVLEARHVGYGGSGRNAGLVNAGVWHPPAKVREALGDHYGKRFLDVFGEGPKRVFDLIEKHQIRCEVTRTGTIHAAVSEAGVADLRSRHAEWQRLGAPVDLLTAAEVKDRAGTDVFHGGLLDHRAGTINPMGYCRGLARAAKAAGARISTGVTVRKLVRDGDGWRVETDRVTLRARNVVIGTNAYSDDLWPGLRSMFTPIHLLQFATMPLGPDAAHILPGRQGLWTNNQFMVWFRRDAFGRLVIGTMGKVFGSAGSGLSHRWAKRQIARIFPDLGPVEFEEAWHGQVAMTPDHLPRICLLDKGLYTGIGYNGRGITTGTIFGKCMADLIAGMPPEDLPLPAVPVKAVASAPIISRLYQTAFTANQIIKSF